MEWAARRDTIRKTAGRLALVTTLRIPLTHDAHNTPTAHSMPRFATHTVSHNIPEIIISKQNLTREKNVEGKVSYFFYQVSLTHADVHFGGGGVKNEERYAQECMRSANMCLRAYGGKIEQFLLMRNISHAIRFSLHRERFKRITFACVGIYKNERNIVINGSPNGN